MSLGILGHRGIGLTDIESQYQTPVPAPAANCWNQSGFKTCHDQNYRACQAYGLTQQSPGKALDNCVYDKDRFCGCAAGVNSPAGGALTMGNKTSDPRVVDLQKAINAVLTKNGYAAVGTDGKLGPGTCGAAREADKFGAGLMAKYGLASVCTSFTTPPKSGGGFTAPSSAPVATPGSSNNVSLTTTQSSFLGMNTQTLLLVAAVAAGAWVFFGPKKGEKAAA